MGEKNRKRKTLVINLETKEEIIYASRFEACRAVGMERKRINVYIDKGIVFKRKYKFVNID